MSQPDQTFTEGDEQEARDKITTIRSSAGSAERFIRMASDPEAIRYLVEEEHLDRDYDSVREEILQSEVTPFDVKQTIFERDRDDLGEILVPERVERNARTALAVGKPVVLYGPTGTGKTHFAKQLLAEECVDYSVDTATPTWTPGNITGSIQPETEDDGTVTYHRRAGCVSEGIQRADEYGENFGVLIDEITRADISQVFGPLYTAVEDDSQEIFRDEDGQSLTLDDDVKIVCTMNMSDRTVNELDDAITRRFAMIELSEYDEYSRKRLYMYWMGKESIFGIDADHSVFTAPMLDTENLKNLQNESDFGIGIVNLVDLLEVHHEGINEGTTTSTDEPITEFGPMHYRDVIQFLGVACDEGGAYEDDHAAAVGEAFATYVVPRLLNSAALPQIRRLQEHYETLDEQFDEFNLGPAIDLVERQESAERRGIAGGAYE